VLREKEEKLPSGLERLNDVFLARKTDEAGPSGAPSDGEVRALGRRPSLAPRFETEERPPIWAAFLVQTEEGNETSLELVH
jgi:hypothetical protein